MTELTTTQEQAIRARLNAATEAPWLAGGPLNPGPDDSLVIYPKQGGVIAYVQPSWDDAELIANAPADLAALLAELDRLRGECQRLANETKHPAWANITDGMVDRAAREIYRQLSGTYGDFCTPSVDQARAVVTAALVPLDRDDAVERMARAFAGLEPGEPWPTNEELGGGPTGTRDDEYRHDCMDRARAALDALHGAPRKGQS